MADYRIAYLIQPVDSVKRKSGVYHVILPVVKLSPVYVKHDCQNENKGPVEVVSTAYLYGFYKVHRSLGPVSPEHKMHTQPPFYLDTALKRLLLAAYSFLKVL